MAAAEELDADRNLSSCDTLLGALWAKDHHLHGNVVGNLQLFSDADKSSPQPSMMRQLIRALHINHSFPFRLHVADPFESVACELCHLAVDADF